MNIKKLNIILIIILGVLFSLNAQFEEFDSTDMMYHVSLVGAISNPGVFLVSPSTRVSEVIKLAHDQFLLNMQKTEEQGTDEQDNKDLLLDENANRNITITRNKKEISVDLLKFNILGDIKNNPYVQDGDIIYVHPKLGEIEITGAVKKEGFYEYCSGDRITDIIDFALGLDYYADKKEVEIYRHNFDSNNERISVDLNKVLINPESSQNLKLEVGDKIYVRYMPNYDDNAQVLIQGEVLYPGYYSIDDSNTTLLEILEMCGGPNEKADLNNSFLQRRSKEDQTDAEFERLKLMLVEDMTELEYQYFKTKSIEMRGKYSIDFYSLWNSKETSLDIKLKNKDYIFISRKSNVVQVSGQVKNPGLITYVPGKDYSYYIEQAGGYSWNARKSKVQLIKATTGERLKPGENDIVEVQDMIFIPEKRDLDWWKIAKDAFLVISQIATTVLIIQNVTTN